jgi:hypothetical protein
MTMQMKLWAMTGRDQEDNGPVEFRGDRVSVSTMPDADVMLDEILDWLMEYADDANEETGEASVAMVRRAFEMIGKISFILAMPDEVRTVEHVRWAFAYVLAELDGKVRLVFANDHAKTRPEEAIAARILARLDPDKGVSVAVLSNMLKLSAEQIGGVLTKLEERGMAVQRIGPRTYRGKKVVSWFPTD